MARTPKGAGPGRLPATRAELIARLVRAGWSVTTTKGKHTRAIPPDGGPYVIFPSTGGDSKGIRNTCQDIRKVTGWDVRNLR